MLYNTQNTRVTEQQLVIPTLKIAAHHINGRVKTSELIIELENYFKPTGTDADILRNRRDSHFSQKVRNLISYRNSPSSFIYQGYAHYHPVSKSNGVIEITDAGRNKILK